MEAIKNQTNYKGGEFEYKDLEDVDEFDEQEANDDNDQPLVIYFAL